MKHVSGFVFAFLFSNLPFFYDLATLYYFSQTSDHHLGQLLFLVLYVYTKYSFSGTKADTNSMYVTMSISGHVHFIPVSVKSLFYNMWPEEQIFEKWKL